MKKFFVRVSMIVFVVASLTSCVDDSAEILPSQIDSLTTETGHDQSGECKDAECG